MPTGYTAGVQDGTVTEFKDFALLCARMIGTNIIMRDEPFNTPIKKYEPSPYYKESLEDAKEKLERVKNMSEAECKEKAHSEIYDDIKRAKEYIKDSEVQQERYNSMLEKVREWIPPTTEHVRFKELMIEQLEDSMKFDCSNGFWEKELEKLKRKTLLTGEEWRQEQIKRLEENVERYSKEYEQEVQRTNERNSWNEQLMKSLE